jgi:hypothetical protein
MEYILLPRRHSPRTLGLLVCWYAGAGVTGMLIAAAIAITLGLLGIPLTPERFSVIFLVAIPLFGAGLFLVFHHVVHPRIMMDREAAHQEVEEFLKRQRL